LGNSIAMFGPAHNKQQQANNKQH